MTDEANDNTSILCEDIPALREIVEKQRTELAALRTLLANERALRERAESKLRDLLRRLYGPKSEKLTDEQLLLFGLTNVPALAVLPTPSNSMNSGTETHFPHISEGICGNFPPGALSRRAIRAR